LSFTLVLSGTHILHEATHGNIFKTKKNNLYLAYFFEVMVCFSYQQYKMRHLKVHHRLTNRGQLDYDLNTNDLIRMSPNFKLKKGHKYQWLYFPFLYSIGIVFISHVEDYKRLISSKVGELKHKKWSNKEILFQVSLKILHIFIFLVLPCTLYPVLNVISCYFLVYALTSLGISFIFQVSHVNTKTYFPKAQKNQTQEDQLNSDNFIHQIKSTVNYAPESKIILFLCGGVNLHIEHHLFPHIPYRELPNVRKIVKQTCKEYSIPYIEFDSYFSLLIDHIRFLKMNGNEN